MVCNRLIFLAFLYILLQWIDAEVAEIFLFTNGTSTWLANAVKISRDCSCCLATYQFKGSTQKNEKEINCEYKVEENHKNTPITWPNQLIIDRWHEELLAKTDDEISSHNKTKLFSAINNI